jgi:hypothetical protein
VLHARDRSLGAESVDLVLPESKLHQDLVVVLARACARVAGTFAIPRTLIGLLTVSVTVLSPCSGTTMSLARSCGSRAVSSGVWMTP